MKSLGRSWQRWEDNSKMDLQEVRWVGMGWMKLVLDRQVAGTCECGNEHAQISQSEVNFTS